MSCTYLNEKFQETLKESNHLVHQYTRSNVRKLLAYELFDVNLVK